MLLTIAYPPFHLFIPSFVCLVPAILLIESGQHDSRPLRRQLSQGFWFGLVTNGFVLYWMVVALLRFTKLSVLGYAATIVILAGYTAVLFGLTGWIRRRTGISMLLVFPVLWTAMEWAVGHQGDIRFPWLGLGTSLTHFPTVVQVADITGARGVTLLLAVANTAVGLAWLRRRDRGYVWRVTGGILLGLAVATGYGLIRERTMELRPLGRVAVVQPNVGYREKQDRALQDSIVTELVELSSTAVARTRPDLMVWPESAVPHYFHLHPTWEPLISAHVRSSGIPIVTGGVHVEWGDTRDDYEYYNSAFLFDSSGSRAPYPVYNKRYLVPIVERVPFVNPRWFNLRWFGGFGIGDLGEVYEVETGRFGMLICYESIFEDLSRSYRRRGADFVINITNDGWYGKTTAPYQHAAHLVMRAIENRMGVARAANTGISEFVDPLGRERQRTKLEVKTFVADTVFTTNARSVYTRLGDWVGLLVVGLAMLLIGYAWWHKPQ